ncbi:MAG: hypothetical protein WC829_21645 [Hyphomicrobium sp.]|jgi:hypothetical protein
MAEVQERLITRLFGAFDKAWTSVCWPLIGFLNLIFRPDHQTGDVAIWKVVAWLAVNTALLYFAVTGLEIQPLLWSLSAFLVIHILIIASSLRIMYEEKRVMEGSLAADKMTFSALDAVNNVPILASSTAFYILGLAAFIQTVEHTGIAQILRQRPTLNSEYGEYLACVLNEIPIVNSALNAWANLVDLSDNLSAQIVYNGITGNSVRLFIVVTLSIIVVRTLLLRFQQWSHQVSMAHALENGTVSPDSVKKRLVRVPTTLNSQLMRSALTHPDSAVRRRALAAMARLEVPNFAREFLESIGQHIERDLGLAHIRETLAAMNATARESMAGELTGVIEKQMMSIKDAIDMQTKQRLDELRAMLKGA